MIADGERKVKKQNSDHKDHTSSFTSLSNSMTTSSLLQRRMGMVKNLSHDFSTEKAKKDSVK